MMCIGRILSLTQDETHDNRGSCAWHSPPGCKAAQYMTKVIGFKSVGIFHASGNGPQFSYPYTISSANEYSILASVAEGSCVA